ncbi:MAG TPA: hypothetical protein VH853_08115 [Polyangia bacterium]|jgi:hypothetical protein|nr:hypothetical protein [Polyangia bacterium]
MNTNCLRAFILGPVLFALAVGLALTASGCVVDGGPSYGYGGCQPDVFVDWQIQNPAGGQVTCDAVGAATVVIDIDGADYPQSCPAGYSYGSQDILLQQTNASYNITVNLEDKNGVALAVPQTTTLDAASCQSYATPGPAILVVTPPTQ